MERAVLGLAGATAAQTAAGVLDLLRNLRAATATMFNCVCLPGTAPPSAEPVSDYCDGGHSSPGGRRPYYASSGRKTRPITSTIRRRLRRRPLPSLFTEKLNPLRVTSIRKIPSGWCLVIWQRD